MQICLMIRTKSGQFPFIGVVDNPVSVKITASQPTPAESHNTTRPTGCRKWTIRRARLGRATVTRRFSFFNLVDCHAEMEPRDLVKSNDALPFVLILFGLCACINAGTRKSIYSAELSSLAVSAQSSYSFSILFQNTGDKPITFVGVNKKDRFELVQPYIVTQEELVEWKDVGFSLGTYFEPPDQVVVNQRKEVELTVNLSSAIFKDHSQVYRLHFCSAGHECLYYTPPFKIDKSMHLEKAD